MRLKILYGLYLVLGLIIIGQWIYADAMLPERVASHFNAQGLADGWMQKGSFLALFAIINGLMAMTFLGIPLWFNRISYELFNLPNKEYWLAPERRGQTLLNLKQHVLGMGLLTIIFLIYTFQDVIHANLIESPKLSPFFLVLTLVYGFALLGWSLMLMVRYQNKPEDIPGFTGN